jgi:hypothetical protein
MNLQNSPFFSLDDNINTLKKKKKNQCHFGI